MSKKQVGRYMLDRKLGRGSYAQVWLGHCEDRAELVAVKVISRHTVSETEQLRQEVTVLKRLQHENIVLFKDLKKSAGHYYLVLEYCAGGDLGKFIQKKQRLSETAAQRFLHQLSEGLLTLHRLSFIHRDLKPQNILLSEDSENAVLKIADFGFARPLNPTDMASTVCGSPLYMAPEILRHEKYDAKADLWSLGAIFYELLFGVPPFSGPNPMQLLANIESSPKWLSIPDKPVTSSQCQSLLRGVLVKLASERMSADTFFFHPFNLGSKQSYKVAAGCGKSITSDDIITDRNADVIPTLSIIAIDETHPSSDDSSGEVVCISFDEETNNFIRSGSSRGSPPKNITVADPATNNIDETKLLRHALDIQQQGLLADSFLGTQCALGIILRAVSHKVMSKNENDDDWCSAALGIIVRSCKLLDSAREHIIDSDASKLIAEELSRSLKIAQIIRDRTTFTGSELSYSLAWIYSYALEGIETFSLLPTNANRCYLETALLLMDYIIVECEENTENLPQELEMDWSKQESACHLVRNHVRLLLT